MDDQLPHPGASSMACVIYGIFSKCHNGVVLGIL
jgi:hypothetical protein